MDTEYPSVIAVIPMKPLSKSKTRLSKELSPDQRGGLTIGMLRRVIMALQSAQLERFWVVGGDQRVRNLTRNANGLWLEELGRNLNDTLGKAFNRVFRDGSSAMYLPGDLPFIKAIDIHSLLQASRQLNNISLVPARQNGGTNAIFVPNGIPFHPELGPNSFTKHLSQATRLGVPIAICYSPGMGFDLDTVADLKTYQDIEAGFLKRLIPNFSSKSVMD